MGRFGMEEIWKPVKGFEGMYEVSDQGRVRVNRPVRASRLEDCFSDGSRPLRQHCRGGYYHVALRFSKYSKPQNIAVHKLVAEAFIGPRPKGKHINHIDKRPTNNKAANLEYVLPRENINHGLMFRDTATNLRGSYKAGKDRENYRSVISVDGQDITLGMFDTPEEAHIAYLAAVHHLGESKYAH
jgi:hypothetical protein